MWFAHCVPCLRERNQTVIIQARFTNDPEAEITVEQWNAGRRKIYPCAMCGNTMPGALRSEDEFFVYVMSYVEGANEAEDLRDDLSE